MECIGSILRQKYTNYEILIIDDGSTDDSENLIKSMNHPKIRYYKNTRNMGIVPSLNRGLRLAKGEYIARMDADDVMVGNRLEEQINFLDKNKDYGMVGGNYQVINELGIYHETINTRTDPEFLRLGLLFRNQFHHSAVTMRTEIAKKLKYSNKFRYCEDFELWTRFAEVSKVSNISSVHLSYRWHENNSCSKNQPILKKSVLSLLSRELDKVGVQHTTAELMIHGFVCFGVGGFIFKDSKRLDELRNWYSKLFATKVLTDQYSSDWLLSFQREILKAYCGIDYGSFEASIQNNNIEILST